MAICSFLVATSAEAQVYRFQELPTPAGYAEAFSVNAKGQVVGTSLNNAFLRQRRDQPLLVLGTLGGSDSNGRAVNKTGEVAGYSYTAANAEIHAFLTEKNGRRLVDLGTLGGIAGFGWAVNDKGQVAGYSFVERDRTFHAFLSAPHGRPLRDLGTLGGIQSWAYAVNKAAQVVGASDLPSGERHAFISERNGGRLRDLGTIGGPGTQSEAYGVNDSGEVVGYFTTSAGEVHAYITEPNGGPMHDLGGLGGTRTYARGINSHGDVVGDSLLPGEEQPHAFLYTEEDGVKDLNTLATLPAGFVLRYAMSINEAGQIVGSGDDNNAGVVRAFLLTPVDNEHE